jgi:hypothetical protein
MMKLFINVCLLCLISLSFAKTDFRVVQVIDDQIWSDPPKIRLDIQIRCDSDDPVSISGLQYSFRIENARGVDEVEITGSAFSALDYEVYQSFRKSDGRLAFAATHRSGDFLKCGRHWTALVRITLVCQSIGSRVGLSENRNSPAFLVLDMDGQDITGEIQPFPAIRQLQNFVFSLKPGWQLISLPGIASSMQVSELFPNAIGGIAFDWRGEVYYPVEHLEPGRGYWIAQNEAQEVTQLIFGSSIYERTFFERGWFLIGGVDRPSSFDAPKVDPSGSIYPPAFFYDQSMQQYRGVTTLNPSVGYWVAVLRPCVLEMPGHETTSVKEHHHGPGTLQADLGTQPPPPPGIDTAVLAGFDSDVPHSCKLLQNHPNPFHSQTSIPFFIRKRERIHIGIYNINGQLVRTLYDQELLPGMHNVIWDGTDQAGQSVGAGVYLCKMQSTGFMDVKKLILVH